jgi:hypothetical protein
MRPQTPHRSPRQAFGGNDNNQLLKLHHNDKNNLARSPLDKIPIAAAMSPSPKGPPSTGGPGRYSNELLCAHAACKPNRPRVNRRQARQKLTVGVTLPTRAGATRRRWGYESPTQDPFAGDGNTAATTEAFQLPACQPSSRSCNYGMLQLDIHDHPKVSRGMLAISQKVDFRFTIPTSWYID